MKINFGKRSDYGIKWFCKLFWTSLLLFKVSRKSIEIIYLVSVNWPHCVRTRQYFSPGDFGECLFTHLFLAKIGPNKPKKLTNNAKESMFLCLWMCRNGYLRKDEKSRENDKTGTRFGKRLNKAGAGEASGQSEVHMVNWNPQSFKNHKNDPWS